MGQISLVGGNFLDGEVLGSRLHQRLELRAIVRVLVQNANVGGGCRCSRRSFSNSSCRAACRSEPWKRSSLRTPPASARSRFVRWYDEKYGVQSVRAGLGEGARHLRREDEHRDGRRSSGPGRGRLPAVQAAGGRDGRKLHRQGSPGRQGVPVATTTWNWSRSSAGRPTSRSRATASPAKPGSLWEKMFHYYSVPPGRLPEALPPAVSNVESTFSMVKAKFRDHVRSKTDMAMKNEVLCKFLCHNIVRRSPVAD